MGFDNECILNIQSLAGEYFCPVCRLLVYPNEALQSQCTHLYCKPCLTYIVNTTRACPYDGYLVTEADSKPLIESNKTLAETIGKIVVHCLYYRSGCQWQGPLSECTSHCAGCAFGNSPVVCNRCGIQIVHRQVQEHAQNCPGVQAAATAASTNAEQTQTANQSGVSTSQAPNSQTITAPPTGLEPNPQASANSLLQAAAPTAMPTPEQWYQQYYQQYPGYDPYQQAYPNYYPYQQQVIQQYQQQPPNVQGQQQPQAYSQLQPPHQPQPQSQPQPQLQTQAQAQAQAQAQLQLQPQPQPQPQPQTQIQPQSQSQSHIQSQSQPHAQSQLHVQPQAQPLTQTQPQTQIQPPAQPHPLQHVQVLAAAVNPQHQLHPMGQSNPQLQPQAHPPPHGQPHPLPQSQPQSYTGGQPHLQPHSQQHMQLAQYQQAPSLVQHAQAHIQPQLRPQVQSHPQSVQQLQPQTNLQAQPQAQLPTPQPQLQQQMVQQNKSLNTQLPTQQAQPHAVTGHQSFPQPQPHQQMQLGAQLPAHMHNQSGPIPQHSVQMYGQFPQQQPQIHPPQSHAPVLNQQQPVVVPPQGHVPSIPPVQQQQLPHAQQPSHPGQQRPLMQPMQHSMPQQHLQPQQPFLGQTLAPVQNQVLPYSHLAQQQPVQSQLRPHGAPQSVQQNSLPYMSSQQNSAVSHGWQSQQSLNHAARPMGPNYGAQSQSFPPSSAGFTGAAHGRPMQIGPNHPPMNQNYLPSANNQLQMSSEHHSLQSGATLKPMVIDRQSDQAHGKSVAKQKDGSPIQKTAQKELNGLAPTLGLGADSSQVKNIVSETDVKLMVNIQKPIGGDDANDGQVDVHGKDTGSDLHPVNSVSSEPEIKHMVKKDSNENSLDTSHDGKSVETLASEQKDTTNVPQQGAHSVADDTSLQHTEPSMEHNANSKKDVVDLGRESRGADMVTQAIPLASSHIPDSSAKSQTFLSSRDRLQHQSQPMHQGAGVDGFKSFPPHDQTLGKGFMHAPHPFPPTDQGRHQPAPMPSAHQLPGPPVPPSGPLHHQLPGQPTSGLRPQGPGLLPPPGQLLNPPDEFHLPMLKQPHGSFHPEIASGGIPGPSATLFGRGSGHEKSFEMQPVASQGHNHQGLMMPPHAGLPRMSQGEIPGSFNSPGGMIGRPRPQGPEMQIHQGPINPAGSEMFSDQRSHHLDGRQPDSHLLGSSRRAPFGQPAGVESNLMRMNEAPGSDSSSAVGLRDDKFKSLAGEGPNHFPVEPSRHVNPVSRPFDKAPHGLNYDTGLKLDPGPAASRFLPPYHPGGLNDAGGRVKPVGPDSSRNHPDFHGPASGFGRHHMEQLTPTSPGGREYTGFASHGFVGLPGFPREQPGLDNIQGPESRHFNGAPRSFNFAPDPVGNPFNETRIPPFPGNLRRGELDGPGNVRNADMVGQDVLSGQLKRGELLGPRNLPGHSGFGAFPAHGHMGDVAGPGNFLHRPPFGEPFGGNKFGHPRLGEPGFRSSYSLTGGLDPFDNSRKRKPGSMGWCRICKVDCETVEGLELHSQTREHQKMAMDMVQSIKQQNAKKQKTFNDHSSLEEPSKLRGPGYGVRGNKP
ncbi:uncharacterized protein LOC127812742 isoform X1 [Diospyros lotus]|uniref:uncharacterized protein LOC127812742 isoform X1 n=1 Tax=Diospyros lotus TaxID=55363 RepID=UPI0022591CEE|nr:uncharacterized protein LOC127812742 isoform X1 [Diospyros lotus]XP_052209229.1 uncharacterized protein LOC127812742 isoform X1 [Diospyros lotus]XP_052209234.1 uncharacterized protein LOC127812742 isoform X1 [Diospyros lotus]XP_052209238.1 uncharacterized protein LOC127812742 isoform X1 [Diospyros lotus]XP_052209242.1 uncharacterized protein LOC127812742 isoform X1 [Diospyros lotus]XP_052209246.1 uncharacterized protein LOC127812742 isoform X1 [Diospyros lotus]XP_052209250.1 uncharacterize